MARSKVPSPPQQAVDQLQAVLDSTEVGRLIRTLEHVRWTGRPGYPIRAMVGMCLVEALYAIPTWSRTVRLVAEHDRLSTILGAVPSQWACYRFARQLRERDDWALGQCVNDVLASLRQEHLEMGHDVAIDASDLPAYANGHRTDHHGSPRKQTDPDASWGHRSAVSTRGKGGFFGYKIDAAVDAATGLPLAWGVRGAQWQESSYALALIDKARSRGFKIGTAIMDKGYDSDEIHQRCMERGIALVIPLRENTVQTGRAEPPWCVHGEWTSQELTTSARQLSGAARLANVKPSRCGARPTGCTR